MDSGAKECSLLWFIENGSYHYPCRDLFSPKFTSEGFGRSSWFLRFGGGRSATLKRSSDEHGPFSLKFQISVTTPDGSTFETEECEHTYGVECKCFDSKPFHERVGLSDRRHTEYLPKDTVRVHCRMWKGKGRIRSVQQFSARTRIGIEKICFLHQVENFSALRPKEKKTLRIPSLSNSGCVFSSSLYVTESISGEMEIYVETLPSDKNYLHHRKRFSLLDVSGNTIECGDVDFRFSGYGEQIEKMNRNLSRELIMKKRNEYLPNDELKLICDYTFSNGVDFEKIEETVHDIPIAAFKHKVYNTQNKKDGEAAGKPITCPSALDDFKTLYSDRLLTDIVLKTATKSFPAHKSVLCARSSVFRAMLTKDMREKNTDCIRVEDLDDETVHQLLLFLYSDDLEEIHWNSALKLYYAGDKYAIEKLKILCSSFLVDNLSTSTASELLLLADTHSDADLKKIIENFILEHEEEVYGSNGWETLSETNPQLALKMMQLKYKVKRK